MSTGPRVAVGGILTECNDFGGQPIDVAAFERFELRYGDDVLGVTGGVMGGMLEVLAEREARPVPLLFASTSPGGPLTDECYDTLRRDLLAALEAVVPVDAVLLALHGAAVSETVDDIEGDLLAAARALVGPGVPIVATLDLHAHVTEAMVTNADGLVAWETYPHRDSYTTGRRGAALLVDAAVGAVRPTMVMAKVPVLTGAVKGSTEGDGPFADMMRKAKALETRPDVLSTSMFLVHPFIDRPGMGSGGLVITDGDTATARDAAVALAEEYWQRRHEFEPDMSTPAEAVRQGLLIDDSPIVLMETADACGGGAAGDSVACIAALAELAPDAVSVAPVVDPEAAAECHAAGVGAEVTLRVGHRLDPRWGDPMTMTGTVEVLTDGRFVYDGGIWEGVVGEMGPTAVLRSGGLQIVIASHPTYEWTGEQYGSVGVDAHTPKFAVAKNPMNYRMVYPDAPVIVIDSPGPTPASVRSLPFERMQRPFFPLDDDIPGLRPTVFS